jgi:MFS family permease
MICLAGAALSYVMLGLATELWMIYAARAFAGAMAGNFGVASAMMADITSARDRARGMGLIGAAFGLGMVLGPVLGGLLSGDSASFTLPCIVAGGMSALAILAAALFLPESLPAEKRRENLVTLGQRERQSVHALLRETHNRLFVFQFVLHTAGVSTITYLYPLWMGDMLGWGAREVGIVFGVQGALMVLFQAGLMGPLVRLLSEWPLLRISLAAFLGGLVTAVFTLDKYVMIGAMFVAMTGSTLCMPLLNTIISQRTQLAHRGRMMGITSAAASWGRVLGPLLAGFCLESFGYRGAWLAGAFLVSGYLGWAVLAGPRGDARDVQA